MWIEPSSYDYYYAPQELEEIAIMESLFSSELGQRVSIVAGGPGLIAMDFSRITDDVLVGTTPGSADFERLLRIWACGW